MEDAVVDASMIRLLIMLILIMLILIMLILIHHVDGWIEALRRTRDLARFAGEFGEFGFADVSESLWSNDDFVHRALDIDPERAGSLRLR